MMKSLVDTEKPSIIKQRDVEHPRLSAKLSDSGNCRGNEDSTTPKTIGMVGWETTREETVFVTERSRDTSMYMNTPSDKEGGYAISESVLSELRSLGVERIYVAEYETYDVYQFGFEQFLNGMRLTHHDNDSQRCVSVDDRENGYQNYLNSLYEGNN